MEGLLCSIHYKMIPLILDTWTIILQILITLKESPVKGRTFCCIYNLFINRFSHQKWTFDGELKLCRRTSQTSEA